MGVRRFSAFASRVPPFISVGNMPTYSSQSALPSQSRALSLLRVGGIQFQASLGVAIAAVVLTLFAIAASRSAGNADVPRVVGLGALFWVSGWLVQAITYLSISRLMGSPASKLCLGVLGVEVGPRRWPASRALLVALATIAALIVLGSFYRLIEGGFRMPQIVRSDQSIWSAPSIGFAKHDSIWRTAAWLCWVQAVLQFYPLPRTLGRQIVSALSAIVSANLEIPLQLTSLRRCLGAVSLLTMGITIISVLTESSFFGVHWFVFFGLSLLLWISTHSADLGLMLAGYRSHATEETGSPPEHPHSPPSQSVLALIRDSLQLWKSRRRLRTAQRREQEEAINAQRLDEILTRLHRDGLESLSPTDRRVLDRVSENLRRQRMQDSLGDPPTD